MKRTALFTCATFVLASALSAQQQGQQQQGQQPQGQRQGGRGGTPDPRTAGGGQCANSPYNCIDTPNPLPAPNTVWLEEMTWMDVRDAMKAGKTTMIITTGGIEPNGPWLALGKHNYVLRANCDAIARKLGNALCAPILPFVPEGAIEPKSGHMTTVGTISMREETFQAILTDMVHSFKMHGFQNIMLIGDSGGNTRGMAAVATKLNTEWNASPVVAHIPEYYAYGAVSDYITKQGLIKEGQSDGLHDDPIITMNMMVADPNSVRWEQRVKAGKATINGVSIADKAKALEIGKKIVEFRADVTATKIKEAIANKGKTGGGGE
ncbi:MAG TPA: creatininase family protein [Vicinamibacterales bacterium]|nr:creatininase family protein [Vicinamibacterales bacterium]